MALGGNPRIQFKNHSASIAHKHKKSFSTMDSQSLSWICYWAFVVYACNKMWDSISHHTSYLCSFLSQFLMYVTLLSTLKSYFSGTEAPVCAATLSWSLASWSAETREVNFYTSELRTTPNKQGRQQNSSERPLNILRLKLQSHSAFLYDKKEIYPFIQSTL